MHIVSPPSAQRSEGSTARPASSVSKQYNRGALPACYLDADIGLRSHNIFKLHSEPCRGNTLLGRLT